MAGMNNFTSSFVSGIRAGQGLREAWDERKAGQAMADLAGYDPMQAQAEAATEGGGFGEQTSGEAKLPSTRDWVTLRQEAMKRAGALGPDAVKDAMDQIDEIQKKGSLDNLYIARELVNQGRSAEAGKYIEAANSYQGNFTALHTSPAQMQDGSTQLAFTLEDEQTGQPRAPGMIATPEVIDRMIMMAENPGKYGQVSHDRQMAERDFETKMGRFAREDYVSDRGYNLDIWKEHQDAMPKAPTYESKDYDEAVQSRLDAMVDPSTGTPSLSPEAVQTIYSKMAEARANPRYRTLDPGTLASFIVSKVAAGAR